MTLTLAAADRNALANTLAHAVDAGPGPGILRIYSGARPAGPGTAVSAQVLLAEFTLKDPAYADAPAGGTGVAQLNVTPAPATVGLAAGVATWARALDSTGVARIDYKVSGPGGNGDIVMSTTTVSVGLALQILSGTLTQPAGTAD